VKFFDWPRPEGRPLRILCLGAHCDDIEIGCGGTLLTLAQRQAIEVRWEIFAATPEREAESRRAAEGLLADTESWELRCRRHRDGFLPYVGGEVKDDFERLKSDCDPDLIFTHHAGDLHQDHRLVCELTWNTFRDHLILEYEIPKFDGDLDRPNLYVPLARETAARKCEILLDAFASQRDRPWFDAELFEGLMRIRGMEANAPGRRAEGFFGRKTVLAGA
jgi:LmbE family N-acetylglucosaminyl deacetylase